MVIILIIHARIYSFLEYYSFLLQILLTPFTITHPLEELSRISHLHPIHVSYIRMSSRDRNAMFSIELEFLLDNPKWLS